MTKKEGKEADEGKDKKERGPKARKRGRLGSNSEGKGNLNPKV